MGCRRFDQQLPRHGHLPEREIMTGIGPVAVCSSRFRDRVGTGEERIVFSSAIPPPYARRSKNLEVVGEQMQRLVVIGRATTISRRSTW